MNLNILTEKLKEFGISETDLTLIESTIQARVDEAVDAKVQDLMESERQSFEAQSQKLVEAVTSKLDAQAQSMQDELDAKYAAKIAALFEATQAEAQAKVDAFVTSMDGYAATLMESLETKYRDNFEAEARAIVESYAKRFDAYSKYVTEEVANKHQTQSELKVTLAESLLNTLREAFVAHNIKLPDAVDFGSEYEQYVTESDAQLKALAEENQALKTQLVEAEKQEIINQVTEGMTVMQKDTFQTMVESVMFIDRDVYLSRVNTLKEKFLATAATTVTVTESVNAGGLNEQAKPVVDMVAKYAYKRTK
jgi:D-alanyl-D-alanine dipeptidase